MEQPFSGIDAYALIFYGTRVVAAGCVDGYGLTAYFGNGCIVDGLWSAVGDLAEYRQLLCGVATVGFDGLLS